MKILLTSLDQMRIFAEVLAGHLQAGDLLILSGNLGAGKTTFTQSLGKALGVAGRITSPTFVIAREHPSLNDGPALVHVDAYRLSDAEELGDLDLDSELEESITVVEWGAGLAEQLSSDHLDLTITPMFLSDDPGETSAAGPPDAVDDAADADDAADDDADADDSDDADVDERRIVELHGHGSTWDDRLRLVGDSIRGLVAVLPEKSVEPDESAHGSESGRTAGTHHEEDHP